MMLRKKDIDALELPKSGQEIYWDDEVPGYLLKVSSTGTKSFVLDYRLHGKRYQKVIGKYGEMTPTEARQMALEWKAKIGQGIEPVERKPKAEFTFERMCEVYVERYASRKKSGKGDVYRLKKYLLPAFGELTLPQIGRAQIAELHHEIGKRAPYEANRNVELIGRIFECAKMWGFYPEDDKNPAKRIEAFPETKRERFVTEKEMPKLMAAIEREESPYIKAILWMYLLLGARKNEIMRLKWSDVDFAKRVVTIADPKGKVGTKSHVLPMPMPVIELLEALPKLIGNPYLFPGRVEGQHLTEISKPWNRIRSRAGLEDVRIHDLRRTLGSWMAQSGVPINIIGKILNHSQLQTTQIYARLSTEPLREVMDQHAEKLLKSARAKVVSRRLFPVK